MEKVASDVVSAQLNHFCSIIVVPIQQCQERSPTKLCVSFFINFPYLIYFETSLLANAVYDDNEFDS